MRWRFLFFQSSKDKWFTEALEVYSKKISNILKFELLAIKAPKLGRDHKADKVKKEQQLLEDKLGKSSYVILFDEKGKSMNSLEFSETLQTLVDGGNGQIDFVIGGAFGVSDEVKNMANLKVNLSPMTLNHHVATIVGLEQVYRALSISKNLPYHNE